MKLVFFGTPNFAVPTLEKLNDSKYSILAVITSPDNKSGRGLKLTSPPVKKFAIKNNLVLKQPYSLKDESLNDFLTNLNADLFVVVAFKILPENIINIPKYGSINLHASLLPKYRGAAPVHHAILNGDKTLGLTTFFLNKKIDTGDILLQNEIKITNNTTTGEALEDLAKMGSILILKTIIEIKNKSILTKKQDDSNASFAPKISTKDSKINWHSNANNIHNQIRAFSPIPGAYTYINNKRIKLFESRIILKNEYKLDPGYICLKNNIFLIGTNTNSISVSKIHIEGKKILTALQFISGYSYLDGKKFD
jgi:methionyl-tRNA formyltransferase